MLGLRTKRLGQTEEQVELLELRRLLAVEAAVLLVRRGGLAMLLGLGKTGGLEVEARQKLKILAVGWELEHQTMALELLVKGTMVVQVTMGGQYALMAAVVEALGALVVMPLGAELQSLAALAA